MKELPILMSGPMVRATITCTKCGHLSIAFPCDNCGSEEFVKIMTRRVVKCNHDLISLSDNAAFRSVSPYPLAEDKSGRTFYFQTPETIIGLNCPYGIPGDRLWVRETWRIASINHTIPGADFLTVQFKEGWGVLPHPQPEKSLFSKLLVHDDLVLGETGIAFGKWRPSIFMPRWASRITLEIVSVRVEGLWDITEEDAKAEGCDTFYRDAFSETPDQLYISARDEFTALWDFINGKKHPWLSNPWTWVIEFKRIA